jgi:hypothetical protein
MQLSGSTFSAGYFADILRVGDSSVEVMTRCGGIAYDASAFQHCDVEVEDQLVEVEDNSSSTCVTASPPAGRTASDGICSARS